jgi:hypothetical protein
MSSSEAAAAIAARASYRLGILLVTASAVAWSTTGFFTRLIPLDTGTLLFWRGLFGGLGILVFIVLQQRRNTVRAFARWVSRPGRSRSFPLWACFASSHRCG